MSELTVLRAQLHAYRDFDECVVLDSRWLDWGTSFKVDLDFIWNDNGSVRSEEESRRIVTIKFTGVSELHIVNALTDAMATSGVAKGWSFGEIACLRVDKAPAPARSRLTIPSFKASFLREGYTWIEVVFTRWEFSEAVQTAHESPLNRD